MWLRLFLLGIWVVLGATRAYAQSSAGTVQDRSLKCSLNQRACGNQRDPCRRLGCTQTLLLDCVPYLPAGAGARLGEEVVRLIRECPQGPPPPARHGVYEVNGRLEIVSAPGRVLEITRAQLPVWARDQLITMGDFSICVGPPGSVSDGDRAILLDGQPLARIGDPTSHGGRIKGGSDRILVNGRPAAVHGSFQACPMNAPVVPHVGGPLVSRANQGLVTEGKTSAPSPSGTKRIEGDFVGIAVGDGVVIGTGPVDAGIVVGKGSLVLDAPLMHDHPAGTRVLRVDAALVKEGRKASEATGRAAPAARYARRGAGWGLVLVKLLALGGLGALVLRWIRRRAPAS